MVRPNKVLIIDDETDLCLLLKSYLTRKNYEVFLSHTLEDGISALEQLHPNILFLDNNLPDGTGWSIAPQIAAQYPNTCINMISAFHPQIPEMPESAKFNVIEKPIRLSDLDRHLQSLEMSA
ncbi:MAG: response regulator [Sphingobacteriales bacterium]|nr:MAG: response regulator [Sphingobacteriales bacterium]